MADTGDCIMGHGEFSPPIMKKPVACHQQHEIMAALFIARETQADSTNGPRHHIVGMFLMSLNVVGTEFQADMFVIVKVFAGEEVSWGERLRHTIRGWEGIQPKHRIGYNMNKHYARDSFKRE